MTPPRWHASVSQVSTQHFVRSPLPSSCTVFTQSFTDNPSRRMATSFSGSSLFLSGGRKREDPGNEVGRMAFFRSYHVTELKRMTAAKCRGLEARCLDQGLDKTQWPQRNPDHFNYSRADYFST